MLKNCTGHPNHHCYLIFIGLILNFIVQSSASSSINGETSNVLHSQTYNVPTFKLSDLRNGNNDDFLRDTLSSSGLLAIRVPIHDGNDSGSTANKHRINPLQSLCHCRENMGPHIPGGNQILLDDGLTTRSTIATATMGTKQPMSLPRDEIMEACNPDHLDGNDKNSVYADLEDARDMVSSVASDAFIPALDRLIFQSNFGTDSFSHSQSSPQSNVILKTKHGKNYNSIESIVDDAVHLEHMHVYEKKMASREKDDVAMPIDTALDWHTDAGLFLAFIPGESCMDETLSNEDDWDDSFRVKIPSSTSTSTSKNSELEMKARFPTAKSGEVIVAIMLGTGAEHWLHIPKTNELKLRATRHAVKMRRGDTRVWYGMMFLVPSHAIVQTSPINRTFSEMRNSVAVHSSSRRYGDESTTQPNNNVAIGCGGLSQHNHESFQQNMVAAPIIVNNSHSSRRRLQHGVDPDSCSNSPDGRDFYCWMQCSTLDDDGLTVREHMDQGETTYCAHLPTLAESKDLDKAVRACKDEFDVVGGTMDSDCANVWHPIVVGTFTYLESDEDQNENESETESKHIGENHNNGTVPNQENAIEPLSNSVEDLYQEKYCYGSTSMYMQGFEWEGSTCVVYLFKSWVLTTRSLFIVACLLTIVFGIAVEMIIKQRRIQVEKISDAKKKLALSAFFYAIQITMGYLIMLVVMTYSGPLNICVVIGLVLGHVIGNLENISGTNKKGTIHLAGGTTPCCVAEKTVKPVETAPEPPEENCCNC